MTSSAVLSPEFRILYPRFSQLLSDAGIPPLVFFKSGTEPDDMLAGESSIIVDSLAFFRSRELDMAAMLDRELVAGARVLCIAQPGNDDDRSLFNAFLERYGMSHLGERHFRLDRYDGPAPANSGKDQLPVVPADIVSATDGLAAGVQQVTLEQPSGLRSTSSETSPLLWALANPDRVNYADIATTPLDGDEAVAQMWTPPGTASPALVAFGDGTWLMDELLGQADNEQLAGNVARWLAGAPLASALAVEAGEVVDRIELTLWDVISRRLQRALGAAWLDTAAELLRAEGLLGDDDAVDEESVMDRLLLRHKIKLAKTSPELDDVYLAGLPSRNAAAGEWGKAIIIRNRLAHAARRATSPVTPEETERLRHLESALNEAWRGELAHEVSD